MSNRPTRHGRKIQSVEVRNGAVAQIRRRDPAFDMNLLHRRAQAAFLTYQSAWVRHDLSSIRAFISDGIHERLWLHFHNQQTEGIRNAMSNILIRRSEIVAISSDRHFDTIHVGINASATAHDAYLLQKYGDPSGLLGRRIALNEVWSFSRRPGVATNVHASLLEGSCPQCGGPILIMDRATCTHCEAVVNSGRYDWVLSEITHGGEWVVPVPSTRMKGWDDIVARDPGLNHQHLEDRASVIFWRAMMSLFYNDRALLAPVMMDGELRVPDAWNLGSGTYWRNLEVDAMEVWAGEPAQADDEFDRLLLHVRWRGCPAEGHRRAPKHLDRERVKSQGLILKRRKGVTSHSDAPFSSACCRGCGGPISVGRQTSCTYCGAALNDGSQDWILEDVCNYEQLAKRTDHSHQAVERVVKLQPAHAYKEVTPENCLELLTALCCMLAADKKLTDDEKKFLYEFAESRGIDRKRLKRTFVEATTTAFPLEILSGFKIDRDFMDQLVRAAMIDGRMTTDERELLIRIAKPLGWNELDVTLALRRHRQHSVREAKRAAKEARKQRLSSQNPQGLGRRPRES